MKSTPAQKFQEAIMEAFEEHYSELKGQKIKEGLRRKRKRDANKRD